MTLFRTKWIRSSDPYTPCGEDDEDAGIKIDFHCTDLPLKDVWEIHGDCQGYITSCYPSWSGSIYEEADKYFNVMGITNFLQAAEAINRLQGQDRIRALEADVKLRAQDMQPTTPELGRVGRRNKPEAYDKVADASCTPGGTETSPAKFEPVSTPEFLDRLKANRGQSLVAQVSRSMVSYNALLRKVDAGGYLNLKTAKPSGKSGPKKLATTTRPDLGESGPGPSCNCITKIYRCRTKQF